MDLTGADDEIGTADFDGRNIGCRSNSWELACQR